MRISSEYNRFEGSLQRKKKKKRDPSSFVDKFSERPPPLPMKHWQIGMFIFKFGYPGHKPFSPGVDVPHL